MKIDQDMTKFEKYRQEKPRVVEMIAEIYDRIPWRRAVAKSLLEQIKYKGSLTPKQESFATSLYIDSCVMTDDEIRRQHECRKLAMRLLKTRLGLVNEFIASVVNQTHSRSLSAAQMRGIQNIAARKKKELDNVPEIEPSQDDWSEEFWSKAKFW